MAAAHYLVLFLLNLVVVTQQDHLLILNTPYGDNRPAPCALTCSGVSKHEEVNHGWTQKDTRDSKLYKMIDLRKCGFVTAPVITATTKGSGWRGRCPPVSINVAGNAGFEVYLDGATVLEVDRSECDVYWSANGFIC